MSLDACAGLVQRGDPDRFATVMAAPVAARALLLPLYAFNLEVARAPWVTKEAMIAEMRLQWWRDALEEMEAGRTRAHEVAGPLAEVVAGRIPTAILDRIVEARRWDIYSDPFDSEEALIAYVDDTAGGLMWAAALALGASPADEAKVRDVAIAGGIASYLRAVPELRARGRQPLPLAFDVQRLAAGGLVRLGSRRGLRRRIAPALWPAWQAGDILALAQAEPERVEDGTLAVTEFRKRGGLLWRAITGRA